MQRGIASLLFLLFLGTRSSLFAQSCLTLFSFDDSTVQEWQYGTSSSYSGSFATSVGVVQSHASTGSYSLQLGFNNMGGKEYAVYYVESSGGWSLSAYQAIKFNLDLSETNLVTGVSVALSTGTDWIWQETSKITSLTAGSNSISLAISQIAALDQVHRIAILLYTANGSGSAFVDTIQFCSASGPAPTSSPTPSAPITSAPITSNAPQPSSPGTCSQFVSAAGTKFAVDGCWMYVSGTNNYYLSYKGDTALNDFMTAMSSLNMNVLRTWGFLDSGSADGKTRFNVDPPGPKEGITFQYWDNGVVQRTGTDGLNKLDKILAAAATKGIKVIIPLVNNWKAFGGMDQYGVWFQTANFHDQFYTNAQSRQAFKNYISVLVNRVNSVNQRKYSEDPTIFSWELANEPRCKGTDWPASSNCGTQMLIDWVSEMSSYIKSLDTNHMVSVGDEGFFNRDGINDWAYDGSEGVDFEAFLRLSTIDFGTLHLYPEDWEKSSDESWATKFILDHIAAAKSVGKPVLLEEYGYKDQSQRNRMYQTWLDVVYNNDGAGDLVWMLAADVGGVPYPDYDHYTIYKTSAAIDVISPHITRMRQKNTCFECPPVGNPSQAGTPTHSSAASCLSTLPLVLVPFIF
jgi:mannan endo-1,4-beta-mannosidase